MKETSLVLLALVLSIWCAIKTSDQVGTWRAGYEDGVRAGIRATIAEVERQLAARQVAR